ncbi:hypothetical protein F5144DRAFT_391357 [Chaetomium tenue]|uniref:Uncharacterized protein n=1 Tax=Chaetomium tenue TaxID=1854479 RepID=A0ACB7NV57_9PEZI|nr:hypothetical protein F5144DRAFT_391357 [Chaetomium globosum]
MGYTLLLRVMSFAEFHTRVSADPIVAAFRDAGSGEQTPEVATAVMHTALAMGTEVGATGHAGAGGEWFRKVFEGVLSRVLGADLAEHLLSRDIEGIVWNDYPMVGWVLNGELREGPSRPCGARLNDMEEDEAEVVDVVLAALIAAAEAGEDLVTIYG